MLQLTEKTSFAAVAASLQVSAAQRIPIWGKKSLKTDGLAMEIMAFHSTGFIHYEIWGKSLPHVHHQLPEISTKMYSCASRLCVQDAN